LAPQRAFLRPGSGTTSFVDLRIKLAYQDIFKNKAVTTLWVGQVFSAIGDALYEVAITWFAVKALGNRAGLIVAAGSGSAILFSLWGGVYADRLNRRKTMIFADIMRALIVLTLPVAARFGTLSPWHLALVTAGLAIFAAIFSPSLTASLPILAPERSTLRAANALMDSTWRIAKAIGPTLTGFLAARMALHDFFSIDALSFLISALALYRLGNRLESQPTPKDKRSVPLLELTQTFKDVAQRAFFSWTLINSFLVCICWSGIFYVGVALLCKDLPQGNIGVFGTAIGAYGTASILSNLFWGSVNPKRPALIMFGGDLILGIGFLLFAQAQSVLAASLTMAIAAIGGPMGDLVTRYLIQHEFANHQIGKVYSLRWTLNNLGVALGLLVSGPVFQWLGTRATISCFATGMIACGIFGLIKFHKESIVEPIADPQIA
jgi:DHA3 family macrolide efflux protein-like MFS transporter